MNWYIIDYDHWNPNNRKTAAVQAHSQPEAEHRFLELVPWARDLQIVEIATSTDQRKIELASLVIGNHFYTV